MLQKINVFLTRMMPVLTPVSVVIGVLLGDAISMWAWVVPWVFAFMTFAGSLTSSFRTLGHTLAHPFPVLVALIVLHIAMPFFAWTAGHFFFPDNPLTVTGIVLSLAIPSGITSILWVTIYQGAVPLSLVIVLISTMLSPIVVPVTMSILAGGKVEMNTLDMMMGLFWMIVLPSLLGMAGHHLLGVKRASSVSQVLAPVSKLSLASVVVINSSVVAPYFQNIDAAFLKTAAVLLCIAICGYLLSWGVAVLVRQPPENAIALLFTGGMRNISAGAVIAVNFFPPAVAVPVVIGMLFQQVLASMHGTLIGRAYKKQAAS